IEKLESSGVADDTFFANAEVVGMKYYDCRDGELVIGSKLILVRDEENEYDRNAVAVYDEENRKVGFLTKRTNASIAIGLDNGKELYAKVSSAPIPDHYPNMKVEIWEEK
ncbi:MAG: HIRAN domain-containing protein, partial [Oscillospiraceae bacterium]|nr:HIRAN domain-containing protein [Oscillospiraceae bacterium]